MSCFDGIGCARVAAEALEPKWPPPRAYISWETDEEACQVTSRMFEVIHRGSFLEEDFNDLKRLLKDIDPNDQCLIMLCAGPPCVDFSVVKGDAGLGKDGPEGVKFEQFVEWQKDLRKIIGRRPMKRLVENVIPQRRGDVIYFENKLGCQAVIMDAADYKKISRPRVWWSDIDWDDEEVKAILGDEVSWKKHFGSWRVTAPQQATEPFIPEGWTQPECWLQHKLLPCLTTPAPTSEGRPAPKSSKGKMDSRTHERWLANNRQYAPWHFQEELMFTDQSGQLQLPSIETKESLHHLPVGYTQGFDERKRHKWLANSWHVGVAKLLLCLIFTQTSAGKATAHPAQPLSDTQFPGLQAVKHLWGDTPPRMGPAAQTPGPSRAIEKELDMWRHWEGANGLGDPRGETFQLEPGLHQVLDVQSAKAAELDTLRDRVCHDIEQLKKMLQPQTRAWWKGLAPHVKALYPDSDSCVQVVTLQYLAEMFSWGDMGILTEMTHGFRLTGKLNSGLGWPKRQDSKYSSPLPWAEFLEANRRYINQKLAKHRTDPHWETLLSEVASDVKKHRMTGPHHGPPEWAHKTVAAAQFKHCQHLLPGPSKHEPTSVAFSIAQTGSDGNQKIRRGEDWRRSHHNETVAVDDVPTNHRSETFVELSRQIASQGRTSLLWGTDQEDAYRQLPLEDPAVSWVLLFTPRGPTLWKHHALLFGSTGSVWAYGRAADFLTWLARTLLLTNVVHFVDDFAAVEPQESADSSFRCCHDLWSCLGFQFKECKKQPPATEHKLQGIVMATRRDRFVMCPDHERLKRVCNRTKEILLENELDDEEAMRLAGKLQFIAETLSGQMLRSCLMPLYQRGYQQSRKTALSEGLRDALETIQHLLVVMKPKTIAFTPSTPAVIYADAFFSAGDKKIRISEAFDADIDADITNLYLNGWGFVAKLPSGLTVYAAGAIPPNLVGQFTSKKAYIYSLEIIAQVIALVVLRPWLPDAIWCWCDNTASETALGKGYGRDRKINRLLACVWTYVSLGQFDPHWRRVASSANISDPISRQDFTIAEANHWHKIEAPWEEIYQTLLSATKSLEHALKMGKRLLSLHGHLPKCDPMAVSSRTTMAEKRLLQTSEPAVRQTAVPNPKRSRGPCTK